MIHPHTELKLINDTVGYGVFATKKIPKGTIVYVKDSMEIEISPDQYLLHQPEIQDAIEKYSYIDERGHRIISWDFGKYVNHSCNCNSISTGYGFEIAIRDIEIGEQITDEYGIFNLQERITLQCECGSEKCRKKIKSSDFEDYYQEWDKKIKQALSHLYEVEQILFSLIDTAIIERLAAYFKNSKDYRSVYNLRYKGQK